MWGNAPGLPVSVAISGLSSTHLIPTLSPSRGENAPLMSGFRNEADFTSGRVNQKSLEGIKTSPSPQEQGWSFAASGASRTPKLFGL